ncbi:MAG TPA: hypothetical protein G4O18_00370 [Dehalococcoidia bacterium]|nr:hypothetical protein [Dehalococcoidia bacterium]
MATKTKAKSKQKRKSPYKKLTLGEEYMARLLEGKPTKRIEQRMQKRAEEEAKARAETKKAKAKTKGRRSSF